MYARTCGRTHTRDRCTEEKSYAFGKPRLVQSGRALRHKKRYTTFREASQNYPRKRNIIAECHYVFYVFIPPFLFRLIVGRSEINRYLRILIDRAAENPCSNLNKRFQL